MKFKFSLALLAATTVMKFALPVQAQEFTSFQELTDFYHDSRAGNLCDDVALGSNSVNNNGSSASSQVWDEQVQGGGNASLLGIVKLRGNGGSTEHQDNRQSNSYNRDRRQLVTGKNCSTNSTNMSNIIMNQQDNETKRYGIDASVQMNEQDNETVRYGIDKKSEMFDRHIRKSYLDDLFQ